MSIPKLAGVKAVDPVWPVAELVDVAH